MFGFMTSCRIHLTGAAGSGVTTLGQALAAEFSIPCHDTDDFYWLPTNPPFREKRLIPDRLRLMREMFLERPAWVLSGALESWGSGLADHFDFVVLVRTRTSLRLERLRRREALRHGFQEIRGTWPVLPESEPFLRWAAEYDHGGLSARSFLRHQIWLESLRCPVLSVDGSRPVAELVESIKGAMYQRGLALAVP
jgi:adenylate kinase family enzyme